MALSLIETRLQRVSKATKNTLVMIKEGPSIETELSRQVEDIMAQTVADRLGLADDFLAMAERLYRMRSNMARPAIARYYYAMYHAMRAASYQHLGGDDHEQHTALATKGIPNDYPNRAFATNDLNYARSLRNEADYEQYPTSESYFRSELKNLRPTATRFVASARQYVTSKGNVYS